MMLQVLMLMLFSTAPLAAAPKRGADGAYKQTMLRAFLGLHHDELAPQAHHDELSIMFDGAQPDAAAPELHLCAPLGYMGHQHTSYHSPPASMPPIPLGVTTTTQ